MMNLFLLAVLLCAAISMIAMCSDRYQQKMAAGRPASLWLRAAGWGLLALAAFPAVWEWGVSIGLSLWLGMIGFASFCSTLFISFREKTAS